MSRPQLPGSSSLDVLQQFRKAAYLKNAVPAAQQRLSRYWLDAVVHQYRFELQLSRDGFNIADNSREETLPAVRGGHENFRNHYETMIAAKQRLMRCSHAHAERSVVERETPAVVLKGEQKFLPEGKRFLHRFHAHSSFSLLQDLMGCARRLAFYP
jgi:hypothetical protein